MTNTSPPPPPPPRPPQRKIARAPASEKDISLSNGLIAGAFGLIGVAALVAPQFVDKVKPGPLAVGAFVSALACLLFLLSIIAGGTAQRKGATPGNPLNGFAVQAILGLLGLVALISAALIYGFNPKSEESLLAKRLGAAEREIHALRAEAASDRSTVAARLATLEARPTTCPKPSDVRPTHGRAQKRPTSVCPTKP